MADFKRSISVFLVSVLLCLPALASGYERADENVHGTRFIMFNNVLAKAYDAYMRYSKEDPLLGVDYPDPVLAVMNLYRYRKGMDVANQTRTKNLLDNFEGDYSGYYGGAYYGDAAYGNKWIPEGVEKNPKKFDFRAFRKDMLNDVIYGPWGRELRDFTKKKTYEKQLYRGAKYGIYMGNESNEYYPGIAAAAFMLNNLPDHMTVREFEWMHRKIYDEIFNGIVFNITVDCIGEIGAYYEHNGLLSGKPMLFKCLNLDEKKFIKTFTPVSRDGLWRTLVGKRNK